jgi:hypothetical protein
MDLKAVTELLEKYDYSLSALEDKTEYNLVLTFLLSLTQRENNFIPAYEYASSMLNEVDGSKEKAALKLKIEQEWFEACMRIVQKDNLFTKMIFWDHMENKALIRGIYIGAKQKWIQKEFDLANELFTSLLQTNSDDNIGARYAVKATDEKMPYDEFILRFTFED